MTLSMYMNFYALTLGHYAPSGLVHRNPYTPQRHEITNTYTLLPGLLLFIICLHGFSIKFRMAQLVSGCFCLCTSDFIDCSYPDYTKCPKCKEHCPPPQKKRLSLKNSKAKQHSTDSKPHLPKRSGENNENKLHLEFLANKENDPCFQFLLNGG